MTHLGLFEGIGGFSLAARWMGWETLAWCEWNDFGQRVLRHHFPEAEGFGDITKTNFSKYYGKIDIITGGFPCQPYSMAGKRKGKDDERHLWPDMLRVIREVSPRYVVGENVLGLVNWSGGLVFEEVQADLETQGYEVLPFVLPAAGLGAPHKRDRVWFVAYSNGIRLEHAKDARNIQGSTDKAQTEGSELTESIEANGDNGDASDTCYKRLQRSENSRGFISIREESHEQFTGCVCTNWENFPNQSPICGGDDGLPDRLDGLTFSKWRNESIKAFGNAIVPQVALQIFKAIEETEKKINL